MFSYPLDSATMLKKRRSLKKELLLSHNSFMRLKIAVLAGSTVNDIIDMLELVLLDYGIEPTFYKSQYGKYWEDAMFPPDELLQFQPDIVFVHTSIRNINVFPSLEGTVEEANDILETEYQKLLEMWQSITEKFQCVIIQNNFELPYYRLLGNSEAVSPFGKITLVNKLNQRIAEYAHQNDNFYIHDINYLSASLGLENWSQPLYWNMYKYTVAVPLIPQFAFNLAAIIKSLQGKNKKVLALDLDNTLWGGVIGEEGVAGIELGGETSLGQAYSEFQSYIKEQKSIGVMLSVCSKNYHENAILGLEYRGSTLKPDDFLTIKANWEPKDKNVLQIATELNIFPDAIVFVDDNPAERKIVSEQLSGVLAPEMDSIENYIRILDRNAYFEVTRLSSDDINRSKMYQENQKRKELKAKFVDYGEYLDSLEMNAVIDTFRQDDFQRIVQLANKSNQFNFTTRRYALPEIEKIAASDEYVTLTGQLSDKFGDNGIVSVVVGKKEGDDLHIDLWIMSCRVLKRDMEFAMLDTLVDRCRMQNIQRIYGYYYPSEKNALVRDTFGQLGFQLHKSSPNGDTVWSLGTADYSNTNKHINIERNKDNAGKNNLRQTEHHI